MVLSRPCYTRPTPDRRQAPPGGCSRLADWLRVVNHLGMEIYDSLTDLMGHTPLLRIRKMAPDLSCTLTAKMEMLNPGGSVKDRIGIRMIEAAEAAGQLRAGGNDRRADLRQHRSGPGDRRGAQGLSLHLHDARQDVPGEDLPAPGVRRRRRDLPDRGTSGTPRLLLPRRRSPRRRNARCVPAQPVLQPGKPEDPLRDDRTRDLGADRRQDHPLRRGRRHRRNDHRRRSLSERTEPRHRRGRRRSARAPCTPARKRSPISPKGSARISTRRRSIPRSSIDGSRSRTRMRSSPPER